MRRLALLAGLSCLLGCPAQPIDALDSGVTRDAGVDLDAGTSDSGMPVADAGTADAGVRDAGVPDAGGTDAGTFDAGTIVDAGLPTDAGGPRVLGPVVTVATDAGLVLGDAGYAHVDLLGRATLPTTLAATLDGGFVVAISAQSLVVADGPRCQLSFVNRYTCDYRWVGPTGTVLATVPNAYGVPHDRGEVMMLFRDDQLECPDPFFANQSLRSAVPVMVDLDTGATRLSWPRTETTALNDVSDKGDLVEDPRNSRSCDAGAGIVLMPVHTFNRVRAPYQKLYGATAHELGAERVLLIDAGYAVARIEANGAETLVAPRGPASYASVHLETFTLQRGSGHYRGAIDGGPLLPLVTLTGQQQLTFEGGRFAAIIEPPDYQARVVIDSLAVLPDLRYPVAGQLLERAPVLFGKDGASRLVVARVDLGTAASSTFTVPFGLYTHEHFPHDDAALVIDSQKVAWLVDASGVNRLADDAVNLPFRNFKAHPNPPNVLLLVLRHVTSGPLELVAVDRRTKRLVTLTRQAHVNLSPGYLGGCDVPGLLTPGNAFIYFAETTAVAGQIDLYLVRSDFSEDPRLVGTTSAAGCTVPVVSRDGTRVAVQESLGGVVTVKTATW